MRATAPAQVDLTSLTVVELRAQARAGGCSGYSRLTKTQLIALLSS
ncbi:MAG TPA: Rho termination factor N-terminal domain-containing protein [Microbacterium sp.]|nr:Rho termination factor N-terminal domain-containing protein [Microbacterium sp.]